MQKWEYRVFRRHLASKGLGFTWKWKVQDCEDETITEMLEAMGEVGWELIEVVREPRATGSPEEMLYHFKRPVNDD